MILDHMLYLPIEKYRERDKKGKKEEKEKLGKKKQVRKMCQGVRIIGRASNQLEPSVG